MISTIKALSSISPDDFSWEVGKGGVTSINYVAANLNATTPFGHYEVSISNDNTDGFMAVPAMVAIAYWVNKN